ncbi:MAG TPA: NADH-quinone oxidoreductase subunit J, partial [Rhodanobacteraceae bacterium]|nr:NADH-quinone oxidoreductase subunit J [Rhodanobacteraceae bacterium]
MDAIVQWTLFVGLSVIAVLGASAMLLTMSMVRAGLALMSSFVALAGLFVLLDADLLAAIQIMMNVGGMLVMILFMVMAMMDPGGEMMWDMKRKMHLAGPGALSMRMPRRAAGNATESPSSQAAAHSTYSCPMHPEVRQDHAGRCPKCGMELVPETGNSSATTYTCPMHPEVRQDHPGRCPKCGMDLVLEHADHGGRVVAAGPMVAHGEHQTMSMTSAQHRQMMIDMAMSTAQLPW